MFAVTTAIRKVHAMTKRIRVVQGGTSAGKSIAILAVLIDKAQRDKKRTITSVVSESVPHLKRGVMRDFRNMMQEQNAWVDAHWNATDSIYTFGNGSVIEFFSSDNGDKLRGARRDRLFINEANNITFDAFEQLEVRTKGFVFIDYNPTNEFWVFTELLPVRTDVEQIILTYKDNEALETSIVQSIEQRQGRKGWWQVYGLGHLGEVEGKIYRDWQIIEQIPHEARLERRGVDFGYANDPTAIVELYRFNGGFIINELAFETGLSNRKIADILLNQDQQVLTICDCAEPKSIAELQACGVKMAIGAQKGPGSVLQGIQFVQDQRVSVTRHSVNVIKDYRNYLWQTDKNGKIINEPEHDFSNSMDAVRYAFNGSVMHKARVAQTVRPVYAGSTYGLRSPFSVRPTFQVPRTQPADGLDF